MLIQVLFTFLLLPASNAEACIGAAEYNSVVTPYDLQQTAKDSKLVVGDVLALAERISISEGLDILTPLSKEIGNHNYFLVAKAGTLKLTDSHGSAKFAVIEPDRKRGGLCSDHRLQTIKKKK